MRGPQVCRVGEGFGCSAALGVLSGSGNLAAFEVI